ncbi:MAG: T9SS type A sorting domain-containing protein [Ignavibacteriae bacterium]|jgi:photosystem II stability/assembly factor-like uncharacterized protein|nr:T9SS type A sorting domain-containing protein [Ignavibacteriota bacterium]
MKLTIIACTLILSFLSQANSQIWDEVSTPFEYERVENLVSLNNEVYISKRDLGLEKTFNYKYSNNDWIRAKNDSLYEVFGTLKHIVQFNNRVLISSTYGIYLSEDSAKSWTKLEGPNFSGDCDISPNGIFAIKTSNENHLFKFDETENLWKPLDEDKQDTLQIFFIKQVESNYTHLFALQQKVANPFKYKDTVSGGIFISTDKGEKWEKTLSDSTLSTMFVTEDYVLVSTKNGKLWKSKDNGKTWNVIEIGTTIISFTLDGERIIGNSSPKGVIESRDNGITWQVINESIYNSQFYKKDNKYFFMNFGLVYESDSLFTEVKHTNLIRKDTRIGFIYDYNDTLLSVGNFQRGVQYSTDNAKSWHTYYPFLEENRVDLTNVYFNRNQIYLLNQGFFLTKIYASNDYGYSFDSVNFGGSINDFTILENKILLSGSFGILESKDYGKTFTTIDTTIIKNNFRIMKMAQTGSDDLLAFSTFNGVFKSSDNAETWSKLVDSLPTDTTFASINSFYEFDDNYYAVNTTPPLIIKSTDKGLSWQKLEIELFNEIQYCYLEMVDENNLILSSYGNGIRGLRITNDQGKNWKRIDEDLPLFSETVETNSYIYRIIGRKGNNIFVGSSTTSYLNGNLFVSTLEKIGVQSSVESEIERNYLYTYPPYPNPAKSEVKILFYWDINLPMTTDDISIYDITGKKIDAVGNISLVKQESHYGNLIWDCSSAQPGIYLINIKHGTEEKAVKVVVE